MQLRITHDTRYRYWPATGRALHMVHLKPPSTRCQQRIDYQLNISPHPVVLQETLDVFGNTRGFFEIDQSHEFLLVRASSLVHTQAPSPVQSQMSWEAARDAFVYHADIEWHPAAEYVYPSIYVHPGAAFAEYALPSFTAGRPLIDAARDLMHRIYTEFTYDANGTEISTPPAEALKNRHGVCQDFSQVMLACLRSLGLPARYVSGYLLTQPPPGMPRLVGSDASHAWVSVFLPDVAAQNGGDGWYDLCPTNHRDGWGTPGDDYVRLAVGRDYFDISPMRGVIHGSGHHELSVGVTVEPFDGSSLADTSIVHP
ncbi:MAG: transglutaminase family protein [Ottowia sp.]|uniref:transglutaminase family protein n=1 Tax=Ottowia sp. TaxID=1898956 RepID=UPI003C718480